MVALFTATAQGLLRGSYLLVHSRELSLLMHPIHVYKHGNWSHIARPKLTSRALSLTV